jgi:hypothetical protein
MACEKGKATHSPSVARSRATSLSEGGFGALAKVFAYVSARLFTNPSACAKMKGNYLKKGDGVLEKICAFILFVARPCVRVLRV